MVNGDSKVRLATGRPGCWIVPGAVLGAIVWIVLIVWIVRAMR